MLIPRGGSAVGIGGRRGGWGSSSDSDGCDHYATRTTGEELDDDDSASNATTVESGISSSIVHRTSRVPSSSSQLAPTSSASTPNKSAAATKERQQQQQPRDRLEQMIETPVGGATGQWPKRRPSKTTSRTSRTRQPNYQPPQPSRRRRRAQPDTAGVLRGEDLLVDFNAATAATAATAGTAPVASVEHCVTQAPGDHDDDSIEDGLIVSSIFPSKFVGVGDDGRATVGRKEGVRGGAGVAAASCVRPSAGQTTSVIVAPFHGPLPVSLAFGSSSDALPMVPVTGETSIVDGSSGARGGKSDLFDDLTAVRGISVGQHAQSKDANHNNPHNQPPTIREKTGSGSSIAANSAAVFPISTWEGAVSGGGIDNGSRVEGGAANDSAILTGKAGGATTSSASSAGAVGGSRADRADGRSFNHPPEPRRAPRLEPAATAATAASAAGVVVHRDHHAQPPHPLKHGLASSAETTTQQSAKTIDRTGVGGGYSMGISGTGVALPWRNSRRQAPTTTSSLTSSTGAGGGAGANRRRFRREQIRASAVGEGGVAGLNWGSDGGATATKGGGSVGGGGGGAVDSELRGGAGEDNRQGAIADPEKGMVLVASAVVVGGGGGGAGGEGGCGARSGSTKGWRAAGDSLANLKARMGVRHQQNPPVAAAAAAGVASGKKNAAEGGGKDRGPPHHIPYQTF